MIAIPVAAPPAADITQSIVDPAQRRTAVQCVPSLARKAGGEISTIDVTRLYRSGHVTMLNGTVRVLQKPAARPAEMAATHVIVMRYSYQCRLERHRMPRIKLILLDD